MILAEIAAAMDSERPGWLDQNEDWRSGANIEQRLCCMLRQTCRAWRRQGDAAALAYLEAHTTSLGCLPLIVIANIIWLARRMQHPGLAVPHCLEFARLALADGFDDLGLEACCAAMFLDTHSDYAVTVSPQRSRAVADMYAAVAARHAARFREIERRPNEPPVKVGLVVSNLVDHVVAYTKTVLHFARHFDRERFALKVYSTENLTQREISYFPFGGCGYRSEETGAASIAECRRMGVPVWLTSRRLAYLDAAADLSRQMAADGLDVAIFQMGLACPIDWLTAALAPVPVKLAVNIGSFLFNPGLTATLYDNAVDIAREAGAADNNMGRRMHMPQGTDIDELEAQPPLDRERFGLPADAVVIGVVSNHLARRLSAEYMTAIADVMHTRPKVWFMPVGAAALPDKAAFFAARGLAQRVAWTPQQPRVGSVLKLMDIYANEFPVGGSQSVIEAMACGLPVAAMRWSAAHAECAGAEAVGTEWAVPGRDPADYARRLVQWIDDPAARRAAGRALRQRARQEYAVAAYVRRTLDLAVELLDQKHADRSQYFGG